MSKIHSAGIVTTEANGSCIMLMGADGGLIGQIAIVGGGEKGQLAQQVADAINAEQDITNSKAVADVLFERVRQRNVEGWTEAHDDEHIGGELAMAAACYADPFSLALDENNTIAPQAIMDEELPFRFPETWSGHWWKPSTERRDLVKAGALILAEIERLDRDKTKLAIHNGKASWVEAYGLDTDYIEDTQRKINS